jgi:uncharacterized protein YneF (UPF0154 family)
MFGGLIMEIIILIVFCLVVGFILGRITKTTKITTTGNNSNDPDKPLTEPE